MLSGLGCPRSVSRPARHAVARFALRPGANHPGSTGACRFAPRISVFLRYAGRGRRTGENRETYFNLMPMPSMRSAERGQRRAAKAAGHFRSFPALHPLRAVVTRTRAPRAGAEIARTRGLLNSMNLIYRRRRRGRPAGIVARCDRRCAARFITCRMERVGWPQAYQKRAGL